MRNRIIPALMRLRHSWLIVALLLIPLNDASADQKARCTGIWGKAGVSPFTAPKMPLQQVVAPNGKISVKASNDGLFLVNGESSIRIENAIGNPPVTEILWSPDSKNFVVNESDGGLVGTWVARLYTLDNNNKPMRSHLKKIVGSIIEQVPQCSPKESANYGAVTWLEGGKELLLIVEVPPHSSCKNMGAIVGLRISLRSLKIIERLSESILREKWSPALGCRFSQVVDVHGQKAKKPSGDG